MRCGSFRFCAAVLFSLFALSLIATVALAFDSPLSSESIRDAYFLATGDADKRNSFFDKYTHHLPAPVTGPNISSIVLETPFASVVQDIALHSLNERAPDVQQQFLGKPATFRIQVQIDFTQTYPKSGATAMQLDDFWNNFDVHLKQGTEIPARSVRGTPILSDQTASGYIGARIVANYDAAKIESGPATVVVTGPDGARAESMFDLGSLR